ncbi:bifunctional [glutamine synthetase] adenylyltransferase/[glutamine synthetase]-adenylyl-L-tyrosine phosphorylase [Paracoccus stylophorae]|uniref:Bifunctional [glutamine synthetase] adenylyltransferase/[glutamine synthetase]-adenylyl-L-tyrosine phosphorylase n=1 Tax=Paracoccus stylophorae TaxID=659350 RepID=A0ABY7SXS0_9RHOB|nr:bifunctional [glutamine synthetase] adenylyltransferase/[glutamine synthetase]-adenylyl-L-tyrosine phosphorylase [Paracoccus stylophorae]WCR11726.1 bifunctional [glutamine synthetase] adenylyltransferase/[glutamine synthetase]-adenylyl-L-tyrosine phosphorylase [Paracoccus stylophorae]
MDFAAAIDRLPLPVDRDRAGRIARRFSDLPQPLTDLLSGTAGSSPYLAGLIESEADWLRSGALDHDDVVARETAGFEDLDAALLGVALRRAKRRVALQVALADLGGVWTLERVTGALSDLADRAVDLALRVHVAHEARRGKLPPTDAPAGGVIALAMGKGGARELNYSSDIDLIVLFDETAYDADDRQEARACLIRATRRMAATLSDVTEHGYVFRTDLRLRPNASVTPVCISTAAALAYYEAEGRTWERAAFIKARPAAGDIAAGQRFLDELRPFVWRKHLDFAAIQDAHDMRLRIRDHKGLGGRLEVAGHDLKLGRGGIREIEFFTQTRQLIAGGREPELRCRDTVGGLAALAARDWIAAEIAAELTDHYRQHREIEHRIQMVNDAQTHHLPRDRDGLATIAALMGRDDVDEWSAGLKTRLERVHELTESFFAPGEVAERPQLSDESRAIIDRWQGYPALRSARAQQIFRRVEPELLDRMARTGHPQEALSRFDSFLSGLPAGVQLFSLFDANPQLIELIVDICGTAPGLASYLARHSAVLDAVLGGSFFAPWPGVAGLQQELQAALQAALDAPDGGYERALDAARRWAHEWHFRIGVHHLRGLIDADEAGLQYADLADACVAALFPVVVADLARRHGAPPGNGAVVMGMGSLGARMLNAASDLDLIVIYDADGVDSSDGPRPLATRPYYARLTQAAITALSAPTARGRLYEVDMRLRPSGRQGPVATSIQSFENYQMTDAWTWEHLALTRARTVGRAGAGSEALAGRIEALRLQVLRQRGDEDLVMPDLAQMRARIFAAKAPDRQWEAKIGPGRLQDIELLAQSLALRAGDGARGTLAQLRAGVRAGLIDKDRSDRLSSIWRFLWRLHASGRLLTDRPLDMDDIGFGGQEFLLRETGCDDLEALRHTLETQTEEAAGIVDAQLSRTDAQAG